MNLAESRRMRDLWLGERVHLSRLLLLAEDA